MSSAEIQPQDLPPARGTWSRLGKPIDLAKWEGDHILSRQTRFQRKTSRS